MITELVADMFILYVVNKHECNLFTMCSFINSLFTVTGKNNTMYGKIRLVRESVISNYQSLFFKLIQLA